MSGDDEAELSGDGDDFDVAGTCQMCGRQPALSVRIRRASGIVTMGIATSNILALCKECGLEHLRTSQKRSVLQVATVNLFAPYALAQNQKWIALLRRLPDPVGEPFRLIGLGTFDVEIEDANGTLNPENRCTVLLNPDTHRLELRASAAPPVEIPIRDISLVRAVKKTPFSTPRALVQTESGVNIRLRDPKKGPGCAHFVQALGPIIQRSGG